MSNSMCRHVLVLVVLAERCVIVIVLFYLIQRTTELCSINKDSKFTSAAVVCRLSHETHTDFVLKDDFFPKIPIEKISTHVVISN